MAITVVITAVSLVFGAETIASRAVISVQTFASVAAPILTSSTSEIIQ